MELEAKATARRTFSYQWLHSGLPLAAAASAHLHVTTAALEHCGEYVCTASNRWGSARSHPVRVCVHEAGGEPHFTQHPRYACSLESLTSSDGSLYRTSRDDT